jgi:hypothetical protein
MLKIIKDFFQDEKIKFTELLQNIRDRTLVVVTFLKIIRTAPIKNELL